MNQNQNPYRDPDDMIDDDSETGEVQRPEQLSLAEKIERMSPADRAELQRQLLSMKTADWAKLVGQQNSREPAAAVLPTLGPAAQDAIAREAHVQSLFQQGRTMEARDAVRAQLRAAARNQLRRGAWGGSQQLDWS